MKTFVRVFLSSATFGIVIALIYWFMSREPAGTVLLGIMAAAFCFAAGYALVAERDAHLDGDEIAAAQAVAGEDMGIFTKESAYPVLIAVAALGLALGILWSPFVAIVSLVAMIVCLWRMGAESSRTA